MILDALRKGDFLRFDYNGQQVDFVVNGFVVNLFTSEVTIRLQEFKDGVAETDIVNVPAEVLKKHVNNNNKEVLGRRPRYPAGLKFSYKGCSYKTMSVTVNEAFELVYLSKRCFGNEFIQLTEKELKTEAIF